MINQTDTTVVLRDVPVAGGTFARLRAHLEAHGQEHLLQFWDELNATQRIHLAEQIERLDLQRLRELVTSYARTPPLPVEPKDLASPDGFVLADEHPRFSAALAREAGEAVLQAGTVGVVLVAGGQGSRLGFAHPKGLFPIGPVSQATLFEILFAKVKAVGDTYGRSLPIYLMTSPATHAETEEFLAANDYFGVAAEDVFLFCQGTMPAVELTTGKILLAEKDTVFESPDGHGGMLAALQNTGAFPHLAERGIEHLFTMQVDNPLVDVASPEAIGYHTLASSDATTLVVRKLGPTEKVGNVVSVRGRTKIIEYSDLPEDVARLEDQDGQLQLWAGNMAVHVWNVAFLATVASDAESLPFHCAKKAIPHIDGGGNRVQPESPNGVKFERFIFDLLPLARRAYIVEVDRDTHFAPLKNPSGSPSDSPETVQAQIAQLHRSWIESAGGSVAAGVTVEVHPSFATSARQIAAKLVSGSHFTEDQVLRGEA